MTAKRPKVEPLIVRVEEAGPVMGQGPTAFRDHFIKTGIIKTFPILPGGRAVGILYADLKRLAQQLASSGETATDGEKKSDDADGA